MSKIPTVIYAIEYVGGFKHAAFYIGTCAASRLHERIQEHMTGRGAIINRRAVEQGVPMRLALVIQGEPTDCGQDHRTERAIKNRHNNARFVASLRKQGQSGTWNGKQYQFVSEAQS